MLAIMMKHVVPVSYMMIMLEFMINRCFFQNAEHAMRHDEDHASNHDEDITIASLVTIMIAFMIKNANN